jgi:hypothetical protein
MNRRLDAAEDEVDLMKAFKGAGGESMRSYDAFKAGWRVRDVNG